MMDLDRLLELRHEIVKTLVSDFMDDFVNDKLLSQYIKYEINDGQFSFNVKDNICLVLPCLTRWLEYNCHVEQIMLELSESELVYVMLVCLAMELDCFRTFNGTLIEVKNDYTPDELIQTFIDLCNTERGEICNE